MVGRSSSPPPDPLAPTQLPADPDINVNPDIDVDLNPDKVDVDLGTKPDQGLPNAPVKPDQGLPPEPVAPMPPVFEAPPAVGNGQEEGAEVDNTLPPGEVVPEPVPEEPEVPPAPTQPEETPPEAPEHN